jgi:predicted protein tyrosine phosphatase
MKKHVFYARPYSRADIESGSVSSDGLISITGTNQLQARVESSLFKNRVLRLVFDDIPNAAWVGKDGILWHGPAPSQLVQALEFARHIHSQATSDTIISIHCEKGRSRSAAIALAIVADSIGIGKEMEAVDFILKVVEPNRKIQFNPGLIRMADKVLDRDGALERAAEQLCPRFVSWRNYWENNGCMLRCN